MQWGNFILLREVVDGERRNRRIKYSPTLFASVEKPTKYKTLNGGYVTPVVHPTMREAKEWIAQYSDQHDIIHGNTPVSYTHLTLPTKA